MERCLSLVVVMLALVGSVRPARAETWMSDNGNGTYSNPLFYEEFSDPSMIRVGPDYYLTGTTMHCMPGLPILHSQDLVNWRLIGYAFDRLDLGPAMRLEGGEIYGQGIWAPSFVHHQGTFYILANVNRFGTQVFRATDPRGPWKHNRIGTGLHDLSVLFDDDGKIYAVYGAGEIRIVELNADLTDLVAGTNRVLIPRGKGMGEGSHFYKLHGKYLIVSAIPGAHTPMVCAQADTLAGPWEVQTISSHESLGIGLSYRLRGNASAGPPFAITPPNINFRGGLWLHQGGIIDTPTGQWWGYSMMDHNAIGRLLCLSPVTWQDGWPFFGLPGNLQRTPRVWIKPDTGRISAPMPLAQRSDDFSGDKLQLLWQWNHVPDDSKWSLTERRGFLRLHALPAKDFWWARNTLTQRAVGPESTVTAQLDAGGMKPGDVAGLALLNLPYAWIGVAKTDSGLEVQHFDQTNGRTLRQPAPSERLWFRAHCNFDIDKADFAFSTDGKTFTPTGSEFTLVFQLKTFQGVRYCVFHYNTSGSPGGYADFDSFTVDEPRPRGLTKPIPVDKPITLTSLADGAVLVARDDVLAAVAPGDPAAAGPAARWRIADRGQGRVALQAASGGFVSVAAPGQAGSVTLKAGDPGPAETFQWVDMQRGDIMLLSLATHRYLLAVPDAPGPVSADHSGPRPDRKDGSCFAWKE
jgi:xylan 1,4-beta-xylosidase